MYYNQLYSGRVWLSPGSMESQLGVVPPAEKLKGMAQLPATETETSSLQNTVTPSRNTGVPLRDSLIGEAVKMGQQDAPPESLSKQYLVAPGLPTISRKLAQRIWELDFIEMEEFLPTNKTIQALELARVTEMGMQSAMHQVQQQAKRVTDLMTWVRCFTLYIAVMSQKRPELTVPMTAHLHMVMRLHCLGGLAWFHYDWKARRETCAMGPTEWGKCDPRQLLCTPGGGFMEDPFDPLPEGTPSGKEAGLSPVTPARPRQPPLQQRSGGSSARKQGGICRLFNRAPAGCSYGDRCIFVHRCTVCRRTDHGRRNCPEEARGSGP